jgi:hypothetical protein
VPRAEFDDAFRHIAAEIGFFARAWNALHNNLATIFAVLLSPSNIMMPIAVWNSTSNDRAQREMLRAPLESWRAHNRGKSNTVDEIEWLLKECDKLSDKRNDALHSPLNILMNTETFEFNVEPNWHQNHPRALKLRGKDVFDEFSRYRAQAECLDQHAIKIWMHLRGGTPLPQRPKLPSTGSTTNPKKQPRPKPTH